MDIDQSRQRLRAFIMERSIRHGDFTLSSGRKSTYFLDGKATTLSAEGAVLVGEVIFDMIKDLDLDAIGGPTLGADPIATAVSIESFRQGKPIDAFIVRKNEAKDHGLRDRIAGPLKPNSRVVVVEDAVTTGGSIRQALDAVREAGHTIVKVITIVDRLEGGEANLKALGYELASVFTVRDLGIDVPGL